MKSPEENTAAVRTPLTSPGTQFLLPSPHSPSVGCTPQARRKSNGRSAHVGKSNTRLLPSEGLSNKPDSWKCKHAT